MIDEAHIQLSPHDEECEECGKMVPHVDATIPAHTEYYLVITGDLRFNVCAAHFATLQLPIVREDEEI